MFFIYQTNILQLNLIDAVVFFIKAICGVFGVNILTWVWVEIYIILHIIRRFTNYRQTKHVMSLAICLQTLLDVWWISICPPFVTPLRMRTGKPSIENTMEKQIVYNLESRFLCHNFDNSYIRWYSKHFFPIFINVKQYKF